MLRGIDVSDWNPDIDWLLVAGAGYSFAMIKATQGTGNVQDTFAGYREAIPAAGMGPVGLYHFAQDGDPVEQADHFCSVVGTLGPDEFAVLDIEGNEDFFTLPLSQWPGFINAFCERVSHSLGEDIAGPIAVYMSESPAKSMPASVARWPLWVAGYVSYTPQTWEDWQVGLWSSPVIWQHSSTESVPGVGGNCDANVAPDDLRARLGLVTPNPQPQREEDMFTYSTAPDVDGGSIWFVTGGVAHRLHLPDDADRINKAGVVSLGEMSESFHDVLDRRG